MPNDTPSLNEAFEKAESTLKNKGNSEEETPKENLEESEVSEEKVKEKLESKETKEQLKETKEAETEEEETLESIDPKTLPDDVKPIYKNLMKGFTQGRQKDREEVTKLREEVETLKREKTQPTQDQPEEEMPKFNTAQEYYTWQAEQTAKKVVAEERLDSFRKQALADYNALDERLTQDGENYDPITDAVIGAQLDIQLANYVKDKGSEIGFDYKKEGKRLIKDWDQYIENRIKSYTDKQNKLAKEKELEFKKKSAPKPTFGKVKSSKRLSIREAMEAAQDKINY